MKVDCKRVRFGSEQVTVSPLTVNALTEDETYHQLKARAKRDASSFDDDLQDSSIALTKNSRLGTAEVAWAKWTSWSQCSESCGTDSVRFRYRLCKNQDSLLREKTSLCSAKDNSKWIEEVNCDVPYCPAGEWGPWYTVQECPKCGYGTMIKQRACMGSNCQGHNLQESVCNTPACVPEWDHWSIWSDCSVDCGGGLKTRKRTCSNGTSVVDTEHCIKDKRDIYIMTGNCNENRCFDMGKLNEVCGKMPLIDEQKRGNNAKLRIYKGEESRLGEIPWQGSWQYRECKSTRQGTLCNWRHVCGTTLIHPSWAITAGHCIMETGTVINLRRPDERKWQISFGRVTSNPNTLFVTSVEKIVVYDGYSYKYIPVADIALIKTKRQVPFNDYIVPACIPDSKEPAVGKSCFVSGYGYKKPNPVKKPINVMEESTKLLHGKVTIVSHKQCLRAGKYYRLLTDDIHMCAAGEDDTCEGDSGGPLVCEEDMNRIRLDNDGNGNDKLHFSSREINEKLPSDNRYFISAVTSFSFAGCGERGHYGIYTRVAKFEKWIKRTLGLDQNIPSRNSQMAFDYEEYDDVLGYDYFGDSGFDEEH